MRKLVNEKQKQEWKNRYLKGETARDIAKDYPQFYESTISRHIKKMGISRNRFSYKTVSERENIRKDYLSGLYCEDIAIKYDVDVHTIYKILDSYGIKRSTGKHSSCNESYFETIDTPDKAYLLGFITADGAITGKYHSSCSIEIKEDDKDLLLFAQQQINPTAKIFHSNYGGKHNLKISFNSKKLCNDLMKYGVVPNKSKTIEMVPCELIPKKLLNYYFRGLIDGDGCVHKDGRVSIYSGSYSYIKSVQETLIQEIGISRLKIYHGTTYFVSWSSKEDKNKLFNYLYNDLSQAFYYKRKYNRLHDNL